MEEQRNYPRKEILSRSAGGGRIPVNLKISKRGIYLELRLTRPAKLAAEEFGEVAIKFADKISPDTNQCLAW